MESLPKVNKQIVSKKTVNNQNDINELAKWIEEAKEPAKVQKPAQKPVQKPKVQPKVQEESKGQTVENKIQQIKPQ